MESKRWRRSGARWSSRRRWGTRCRDAGGRGAGIEGPPQEADEEPGLRWACSALEGRGRLLLALGDSLAAVSAVLDPASQNWSEFRSPLD